jgi:DtxR family Mn-dependent transcriptional regulator
MATIAAENLLKAILELDENGEPVIAARLAEFLKISSAAVSMSLKRLQRKGLVRVSRAHAIQLTPRGVLSATELVRRHRLIERLLVDVLHMPWEKVHEEAEKLEHAISPELESRLMELFGADGKCPHGNPFTPRLPHRRAPRTYPLTEAPEGKRLRVVRIAELHEKEKDFLISLAQLDLKPGSQLVLAGKTFDGILELKVGGKKATFASQSGARIWVEAI